MIEGVRGTGSQAEPATGPQEAPRERIRKRMGEVEKESLPLFYILGGAIALPIVLFLLKLLFNIFVKPVVRPAVRFRRAGPVTRPTRAQLRKLLSMARRYERSGVFLDAAQLFEGADELQTALSGCSGAPPPDADRRPHLKRAADLYEKGAEYRKAAELFEKLRVPGRTQELYVLCGKELESEAKYLLAADMYAKGKDFVAAAAMNEVGGHLHGAAAYYEKSGDQLKAAKLYHKFYEQEKLQYGGRAVDKHAYMYVRKYALKSARLYAHQNKFQMAAEIFEEFAEHVAAGKMFMKAGRHVDAVKVLAKSDDVDLLKQALEKAPMSELPSDLLAAVMEKVGDLGAASSELMKAGKTVEATSLYERMGQLDKAAEICEGKGDLQSAAELYARHGDMEHAAELYLKMGDKKTAMEAYRRLGDAQKVAELRASMGDFLESAKEMFELGKEEDALSMLRKVQPEHPDFVDANLLFAERLMRTQQFAQARDALEKALQKATPRSSQAAEVYYMLATTFLRADMFEKAKECLEHVIDIDYSFRDAGKLYDSLMSGPGKPKS